MTLKRPIGERGASEASLEAAVEVPLVFNAAVEGGFENTFIGGAEEPCRVVDPQAVDEFGWGATTVFSECAGGVFRGSPGKMDQGG